MHTIRVCHVVNYKSLYSPPWPVWTPAPLSVETSSPVDSAPAKSSKKDHSRFWNVSFVSALVVGFRLCASLQVPSSFKKNHPHRPHPQIYHTPVNSCTPLHLGHWCVARCRGLKGIHIVRWTDRRPIQSGRKAFCFRSR